MGKSAELDHLRKIGTNEGSKSRQEEDEPPKAEGLLAIGAGLPPVPQRLVARIQAGEFVDMAELLPDRLGVSAVPIFRRRQGEEAGAKILEWVSASAYTCPCSPKKHQTGYKICWGTKA